MVKLVEVKNIAAVVWFVVSVLSLYVTLCVGYPLKWFSPSVWRAWLDLLKRSFCVLLIVMIRITSPAKVHIYSQNAGLRFKLKDGTLHSALGQRAVIMANHQIYSDWIYLWWIAYTSDLHGALTIALKKSLRDVPVLGWAMRSFKFMFMSRKWADDQKHINEVTDHLASDKAWPSWMVLFPEGTVFNQNTQKKANAYAQKVGVPEKLVPSEVLLPRSTGLQAVLRGLKKTVPVLYDMTISYGPRASGTAAEDHYSLRRTFIEGNGPKDIRIHIREFKVEDIPYNESEDIFRNWLYERWVEKDAILRDLAAGGRESEFLASGPVCLNSLTELYPVYNVPLTIGLLWNLGRTVFR